MSLPTNFFIGRGGGAASEWDWTGVTSINSHVKEHSYSNSDHYNNSIKDLRFSADGTSAHLFPYSPTNSITRYNNMTTPFDLRTATSQTQITTFTSSGYETVWSFSHDGMYFIAGNRTNIYSYALSSPYAINGISVGGYQTTHSGNNMHNAEFNEDGTKMWTYGRYSDELFVYDLATPYDIGGTKTLNSQFSASNAALALQSNLNIYGVQTNRAGTRVASINSFQDNYLYIRGFNGASFDFTNLSGYSRAASPILTSGLFSGNTRNAEMMVAITPDYVYWSDNYNGGTFQQFAATVI